MRNNLFGSEMRVGFRWLPTRDGLGKTNMYGSITLVDAGGRARSCVLAEVQLPEINCLTNSALDPLGESCTCKDLAAEQGETGNGG